MSGHRGAAARGRRRATALGADAMAAATPAIRDLSLALAGLTDDAGAAPTASRAAAALDTVRL